MPITDPLFFLHHTQLDRLWWIWQNTQNRGKQLEYSGKAARNSTNQALITDAIRMGGLAPDIQVSEILDTQTELLCYRY